MKEVLWTERWNPAPGKGRSRALSADLSFPNRLIVDLLNRKSFISMVIVEASCLCASTHFPYSYI